MAKNMPPVAQTHVWCTPQYILDALGKFDLDPCACEQRKLKGVRRHYYTDGLSKAWNGRVWCNPPYGAEGYKWLERMAEHGNGIALYPCRFETVGFYKAVWCKAHALLIFSGRPHFLRPDGSVPPGNTGAPSCLIAYSAEDARILRSCSIAGIYTENWGKTGG